MGSYHDSHFDGCKIRLLLVIESELAKNIVHPTQVQTYICEQLHSVVIRLSKTTCKNIAPTEDLEPVKSTQQIAQTNDSRRLLQQILLSAACVVLRRRGVSSDNDHTWPCRHPGSRPSIVYMGFYREKILIYSSKFKVS